ncbi:hypothetical protein [Embleya sp. NBC_00888]|uniref:hypothetical protein n=1 Tax=Embleya sp. NBC_00888 TaxID=2975960 RepID=UPI002F909298
MPDEAAGDQAMAALVLREGARFDPAEFAAWQAAQPDLSPTWRPRYIRVADELPHIRTHKALTRVLARQAWHSGPGEVWWRPDGAGRDCAYRPLTDPDVTALESRFAEHGRAHVLDLLDRPEARKQWWKRPRKPTRLRPAGARRGRVRRISGPA